VYHPYSLSQPMRKVGPVNLREKLQKIKGKNYLQKSMPCFSS
jgi:hypothetical protein